jgi:hypothetical protein
LSSTDILGCFEAGPSSLRKQLKLFPKTPKDIGTRVLLYTPQNPDDAVEMDWSGQSTMLAPADGFHLDPTRRTVFFIHGYNGSKNTSSSLAVRKGFMENVGVSMFLA